MRFLIVLLAMMSVATTAMAEKDETTVYVRNHSCKSLFSDKIDVHVYDSHNSHCTHTWVKGIKKGHSKQVTLKIDKCRYIAEAAGTVMGKREFNPKEDAEFNCYSNASYVHTVMYTGDLRLNSPRGLNHSFLGV